MLATVIFSLLAALTVWLAGRRHAARDPRLTAVALGLLALFPLLLWLPKIPLLPADFELPRHLNARWNLGPWVGAIWFTGCCIAIAKLLLAWRTLRRWH